MFLKFFFLIVSFIYVKTNVYFWSRSYRKQSLLWPLLREKTYSTSTFLKFHIHRAENSVRSSQNIFDKSSRVLILVFPRK